MFSRNVALVYLCLLFARSVNAQSIEYPLQIGNQWIYRSNQARHSTIWTVEAKAVDEFGGRRYTRLEGFPWGTIWLREAPDGKLLAWSAELRREDVWVDFGVPEDVEFPSVADPCTAFGKIVSYETRYWGPIGNFGNAILVKYGPNACADAGLNQEYYLPGVGLVHRAHLTIAGPTSFDLIYARIGSRTYLSEPHISFSLALDRSIYELKPNEPGATENVMTARLTVRNDHLDPLRIQFPTGQIFDLTIRNDRAETLYRWSEGQGFTQAEQVLEIVGERNYVIRLRLSESNSGAPLPPGNYVAEGWLTTHSAQTFRAEVSFEIRHLPSDLFEEKTAGR
jgi:Intracellular proteinase inhibitor